MDENQLLNALMFGVLALVMFGLGLSLTWDDFSRLLRYPRAVVVALGLQIVALPLLCFGLVTGLGLPAVFAVGLMLLAASPGGISANLFSHIFGGNVAMNISLTALNTVLSVVSMPLIINWSIAYFAEAGQIVPVQFTKLVEVVGMVLIPVALGMLTARQAPGFAARMHRPVKVFSMLVLAAVALLAMGKEWRALAASFGEIGPAVVLFNLCSLVAGYGLSRASRLDKPICIAVAFEIGIHNSTLAIFIALTVLDSYQLALPAAVYSVVMYLTAPVFGYLVRRPDGGRPQQA
jgi:BASS family bile acid:Na+ symporter